MLKKMAPTGKWTPSATELLLLDCRELFFQALGIDCAWNTRSVGKEKGRRTGYAKFASKLEYFFVWCGGAGVGRGRRGLAVQHPVVPSLDTVRSTPDILRLD